MKRTKNYLMIALAAICCVALGTTGSHAEVKVEIGPQQPVAKVKMKMGRPVVKRMPKYQQPKEIQVQEKPKYQDTKAGKVSTPADDRGLQVTIQPQKDSFNVIEPLAFTVILKNISKKTIVLHRGEVLGPNPKLVVANMKTAAQWTVKADFSDNKREKSITLKPGEELKRTLIASAVSHRNIRPGQIMPFPQPIRPRPPVFRGKPVQMKIINGKVFKIINGKAVEVKKNKDVKKKAAPKKAVAPKRVGPVAKPVKRQIKLQAGGFNGVAIGAPARVVAKVVQAQEVKDKKANAKPKKDVRVKKRVVINQPIARCGVGIVEFVQNGNVNLPCGKGDCRATLFLEFKKDPREMKYAHPHWTGKIASKPVDFEVAEYAIIIDHRKKKDATKKK